MSRSKYVGQTIGPFKILSTRQDITSGGNSITRYECECIKCGDIQFKQLHHIKQFQGDGCLSCTEKTPPKLRLSMEERNYKNYKYKIEKQTDKLFGLSLEDFNSLVTQNCYYCDSEPIFPERFKNEFKNRDVVYFNGIDRINSSLGYIKENCVPCCNKCNRMKSDFTKAEFLEHVEKIYLFNQSSTTSAEHVLPSGEEKEGT